MPTENEANYQLCPFLINRRDFLKLAMLGGTLTGVWCLTGCLAKEESIKPAEPTAIIVPTTPAKLQGDFTNMSYCGILCQEACPESAYPKSCGGCKSTGTLHSSFTLICEIRKCASQKDVLTCAHCDEYPTCTAKTWTMYPGLKTRIESIRKDLNE